MSTIAKRSIYVGPADGADSKPLKIEGVNLTASLLPGTVVEQVATGLQANASAATLFGQELLVADKDVVKAKSVDDAWTQNENMVAIKARSGDILNVLGASGNNIAAKGTPLSLNGSGLLQIATVPAAVDATSEQVVAYADEIINLAADGLVRVRVA